MKSFQFQVFVSSYHGIFVIMDSKKDRKTIDKILSKFIHKLIWQPLNWEHKERILSKPIQIEI